MRRAGIVFILILGFLFSVLSQISMAAIDVEQPGKNTGPPAYFQVCYSLEIVELATAEVREIGLETLDIETGVEQGDNKIRFITPEKLVESGQDGTLLNMRIGEQKDVSKVISRPQIVVVPGESAALNIIEEEFLPAGKDSKYAKRGRLFELELTPVKNPDLEKKKILTEIRLRTGEGIDGLETEVPVDIGKHTLLGLISSKKDKLIHPKRLDRGQKTNLYAVYITARIGNVITLPDLCGSVRGLEELLDKEIILRDAHIISIVMHNSVKWQVSVQGYLKTLSNRELFFDFNRPLDGLHELGIKNILGENPGIGGGLIATGGDDIFLAVILEDEVGSDNLRLNTCLQPVMNIETTETELWWKLELKKIGNPGIGLSYSSEGDIDFGQISGNIALDTNKNLIMGYKSEIKANPRNSFWLGLELHL